MRVAFFDTHRFERPFFDGANARRGHAIDYLEPRLTAVTARLAAGHDAACSFVNDRVDREALDTLRSLGVRIVATRSAGYNHIDVAAARELGIRVVRVPEYSPHAVAEHAVALALALDRKIHRAYARVREGNFSLDGLVGFDLHGKTVGVVGTGRIGSAAARIFHGFGCEVIAFDVRRDAALSGPGGCLRYVALDELWSRSDLITLHVPLTPDTFHLIDEAAIARMKRGVMLVNTGRGALIDTRALITALKSGHVGHAALDVYEEEEGVFFRDLSDRVIQDDVLARLLTFPNVLVTAHQGFLTREALERIADTTLESLAAFERGDPLEHEVLPPPS